MTFLGNLNQDQVIREILGCDLLILPSITETFGVIIIEALALGRPVVATRCGGPDSIIDPSSGLLVDPQSSDAIARGIAEIASNLNLYEPDTIRTECLEKFGSRVFTQRVLEFYDAATDMNEPA